MSSEFQKKSAKAGMRVNRLKSKCQLVKQTLFSPQSHKIYLELVINIHLADIAFN